MIFMTREQMREYDRLAIEEYGLPGLVLMENAGRGAAAIVEQYLTGRSSDMAAIVCGGGNNGGDGFVIARHLTNAGHFVRVYLLADRARVTGDAGTNMQVFLKMGGEVVDCVEPGAFAGHAEELEGVDVIVDALLGTGLDREVSGPIREAIQTLNLAPPPKIAIDIPSGVSADSGLVLGAAVKATATATFGFLKRGLLLFPGAEHAGMVHVVDIGAPAQAADQAGHEGTLLQEEDAVALVRPRKADATKDDFGHLLVMAGSPPGRNGPSLLCAEAAMRAGAGQVTLLTAREEAGLLEARSREVLVDHVVDRHDSSLTGEAIAKLGALLDGARAIALGPGCCGSPANAAALLELLEKARRPMVLDADALDVLAAQPEAAAGLAAPLVLTPDVGEMARLAGLDEEAVLGDRVGVARAQAERFQAIVALKGAHTLIAAPDGSLFINSTGNPGMASKGMGAVLTGLIGSFLAQGHDALEAACLGVFLHGFAGDAAAVDRGERGLVASDLLDFVPRALRAWEKGRLVAAS
jgi:ADP-dependent NAD(P)H-hydrate dehydratase / NAD(P)H-hydrate epimerase